MTIIEIRDKVEAGETVQIETKYWKVLQDQMEAHLRRCCWHLLVANGVISISKEGGGSNG